MSTKRFPHKRRFGQLCDLSMIEAMILQSKLSFANEQSIKISNPINDLIREFDCYEQNCTSSYIAKSPLTMNDGKRHVHVFGLNSRADSAQRAINTFTLNQNCEASDGATCFSVLEDITGILWLSPLTRPCFFESVVCLLDPLLCCLGKQASKINLILLGTHETEIAWQSVTVATASTAAKMVCKVCL